MDSVKIIPFHPAHGAEVARLHRLALPNGFLSKLGDGFLGELYEAIGKAPRSGVWVAIGDSGQILGFISGTADVRRSFRDVLWRSWHRLIRYLFPSLWSWSALRHIVETLTYPFRSSSEENTAARALQLPGELLSVAVSENARGQGVGRKLVETLETALGEWGYRGEYRVVTDSQDPRSNAFYLGVGFSAAGTFTHHGHLMSVFTKPLEPEPTSPKQQRKEP